MKNLSVMRVFGVTLMAIAAITAVVPQFVTCHHFGKAIALASGKLVEMKCLWTARAEIALAIPLLAVGIMMTFSRRKEALQGLFPLGGLLGLAVMSVPTALIGVCATPMMLCNSVMLPTLVVMGSLTVITNAAGFAVNRLSKERAHEYDKVSSPQY